jgi:CRISPR system Cascade subunit CasC
MRQYVSGQGLLDAQSLGHRTKRLVEALGERLKDKPADEVKAAIERLLSSRQLSITDKDLTQYLLFLGEREIDGLADLVREHWETLTVAAVPQEADKGKKKSSKDKKKDAAQAIPAEIGKSIDSILNGGKAADVAMFGRMLADLPEFNVDAACQVAHAISVNKVNVEFDYYTAVDDLKPEDQAGADMIGTVELTSACFYRYATIHGPQLIKNLQDDEELAEKAVLAFLRAAVEAVPTGKQNSTAAHNPPSLVMVVVRSTGCVNLANAFVKPVRSRDSEGHDLVTEAVRALGDQWSSLNKMYPTKTVCVALATSVSHEALNGLKSSAKDSVDDVYALVASAIKGKLKEVGR